MSLASSAEPARTRAGAAQVELRLLGPGDEELLLGALRWARPGLSTPVGRVRELLREGRQFFLVALLNGAPVGWVVAHWLERLQGSAIFIDEVEVRPEFRGQGLGTRLMAGFRALARERGACGMLVLTNRSNDAAMRLYEKTGGLRRQRDEALFEYRL